MKVITFINCYLYVDICPFLEQKTHLQYECDKEIAQIRLKYEIKQQEVDAESSTKKEEFDDNQKKVCMNVILADAFMSTYMELIPAGRSGSQQGTYFL